MSTDVAESGATPDVATTGATPAPEATPSEPSTEDSTVSTETPSEPSNPLLNSLGEDGEHFRKKYKTDAEFVKGVSSGERTSSARCLPGLAD